MDNLQAKTEMIRSQGIAPIEYECKKCNDVGSYIVKMKRGYFIGEVEQEEEIYQECECRKQKKINRLVASSAITDEFQKMGFGNYQTDCKDVVVKKMKDTAFQYYDSFHDIKGTRQNSIALIGQPGVGKTHLLMAVANNLITRKMIPVMYFPYVDVIKEMQANQLAKEHVITERAKNVAVLFIDDLFKPSGDRPPSSWQQEKMYEIINHRYLNYKPMLISSELGFGELVTINEALGSRIFEMCEGYAVHAKKDFRLNHRTRKIFGGV